MGRLSRYGSNAVAIRSAAGNTTVYYGAGNRQTDGASDAAQGVGSTQAIADYMAQVQAQGDRYVAGVTQSALSDYAAAGGHFIGYEPGTFTEVRGGGPQHATPIQVMHFQTKDGKNEYVYPERGSERYASSDVVIWR
jgi:hypothetical protein